METIGYVRIPSVPAPKIGAVQWYQWEFLRRNPVFRKDYQRYRQRSKNTSKIMHRKENDGKIQRLQYAFSKRWGIGLRFNLDLDRSLDNQPGLMPHIVFQLFTEPRMAVVPGRNSHPLVPPRGIGVNHWDRRIINLQVNLDASFDEIRREFNYWVVVWKTLRSSRVRQPKKRHRFDAWKDQLKVYDLRTSGKNFREIAQHLYPNYPARTGEDRAKKAHQAAHILMSGGYRKISL